METDFHPNTVLICTVCSDAVVIRCANMSARIPDVESTYVLRLTSCNTCTNKFKRSNKNRDADMTRTTSTEISSDDPMCSDPEMDTDEFAEMSTTVGKRILEPFNTPVGMIVVASLPMYKRLMSYLSGNMIVGTLNGFCVIEHLNMVTPDSVFSPVITSVIVGVETEKKTSPCGCMNDHVKEIVKEIPYDNTTFFGDVLL